MTRPGGFYHKKGVQIVRPSATFPIQGRVFQFIIVALLLALFLIPAFDKSHRNHRQRLWSQSEMENEVYMTLLAPPTPHPASNRRIDFYFEATRILAYRLLHKPSTKDLHRRPFVVLTTESVPPQQIQVLRSYGAIVRPVTSIGLPRGSNSPENNQQSKDRFTKLQIWSMTEYSKILYLEPDVLPIRPLSAVFETPFSKDKYGTQYLFAAVYDSEEVRDSGKFTNPIPKLRLDDTSAGETFNIGMFLIRPTVQHALYVNSTYNDPRKAQYFTDMTEQTLLRYAYRKDGPYPWTRLSQIYNTQWPRLEDLSNSHAIRGQFWNEDTSVSWDLRRFWYFAWGEMRGFNVNKKGRKN